MKQSWAVHVTMLVAMCLPMAASAHVVPMSEIESAREVAEQELLDLSLRGETRKVLGYKASLMAEAHLGEPFIESAASGGLTENFDAKMEQLSNFLIGYHICFPVFLDSIVIGSLNVMTDKETGSQRVVLRGGPIRAGQVEEIRELYPSSDDYEVEVLNLDELGNFYVVTRAGKAVVMSGAHSNGAFALGADRDGAYHLEFVPIRSVLQTVNETLQIKRGE